MREAAIPGYRLSKARASTRILVSLGLLGLFMGLLGAVGLTLTRTGVSTSSVQKYYLGEDFGESDSLAALTSEHSGPRPFGELAEVTHLHLTGGAMLLFLLCHLLALCEVRDSLRSTLYVLSFGSFLLTFGLPWLIIYAHPTFAFAFIPSITLFFLTLIALITIPLKEMWLR